VDRKIWRKSYGSIPGLPCPRCKPGTLRSNSKLFYRKQPKYVTTGFSELALHDVSEGRSTCFLTCDYGFCGEVVAVNGDFRSHDEYVFNPDTEEHEVLEDITLVPKSMVPAPPIIKWPEKLDSVPREHLFHSFELFWMNRGACAGRLRIFIEALLDQLGVVREAIKRNGKKGTLDLSERIDELDKLKPGHKAALDALRSRRKLIDDGTTYVYGVYQSDPNIHLRGKVSEIHYGRFKYKIVGSPIVNLIGHYWTDRNTTGSIILRDKVSSYFSSYDSADLGYKGTQITKV